MKHINKIFSLLLALVMVLSLTTTAFAANITIDDEDVVTGAEYSAYKLLNATDGGNGKFAYTVNATYRAVLQKVVLAALDKETVTDDEIVAYIAGLNKEGIRDFADAVFELVKGTKADYEAKENVFEDVAQGYYLIVETKNGSVTGYEKDTYSLVMLDTAGNEDITVKTKEELPESEKKIKDKNDSTGDVTNWQDSADYDIGDDVPFQITFTLPADFANYETYYVGVHDKQDEDLTFNEESLTVTVNGDEDKDLTGDFDYSAAATDGCTFHIICADIIAAAKAKNITLAAGDKIVFNYTAELGEGAELGKTGNPNEMRVEFSNNPYGDGTSKTPWDKVIVFTYKVNVDKVHKTGENEDKTPIFSALTGAGFTLYKEVATKTDDAKTGAEIKATLDPIVKADALADGKYYIVVAQEAAAADGATFGFKGVDDGNYVLVETKVPDGYNAWKSVAFTISATHDKESDDPQLTELKGGDLVTGEFKDSGIITTEIENKSGLELPSTGGIGTTIFYIVGGLLTVGAVVLLVTKKRMGADA